MERLIPMMMFLMILAIGAIIRGASQKGNARSASSAARQRMEEDKQRVRESLMNRANQDMRARSAASSRPSSFEPEDEGWDSARSFHEGEDPCHDGVSPLSSAETDSPAAIDYGRARELMRGIVISEVLTRRRRRTR